MLYAYMQSTFDAVYIYICLLSMLDTYMRISATAPLSPRASSSRKRSPNLAAVYVHLVAAHVYLVAVYVDLVAVYVYVVPWSEFPIVLPRVVLSQAVSPPLPSERVGVSGLTS